LQQSGKIDRLEPRRWRLIAQRLSLHFPNAGSITAPAFLLLAVATRSQSFAKHSPPMLLAHFVGDAGRKWIKADVIAGPARALEGCTFPAARGTACANAQSVA
jgi:hypothetical protein